MGSESKKTNKSKVINKNSFKKIIDVGHIPISRKIPVDEPKTGSSRFAFSLRFFRQIKYFQIGQLNASWYISLIERLQELSVKEKRVGTVQV